MKIALLTIFVAPSLVLTGMILAFAAQKAAPFLMDWEVG